MLSHCQFIHGSGLSIQKNMLFCNPQIGNLWGLLAKSDAEKWSDYK